jgi:hypothetical protein
VSGVDLYMAKELLGHSDFAMTQRYAHLAPEHKAAAVERLVSGEKKSPLRGLNSEARQLGYRRPSLPSGRAACRRTLARSPGDDPSYKGTQPRLKCRD